MRHRLARVAGLRRSAMILLGVALAACSDATSAPNHSLVRPTADILDGAHSGGNAHFYFLPPMVPQPAYTGTSDGTKSPVVKVCVWSAVPAPGACGAVVAVFSTTSGTASQTIRYDATAQQYIVNWQTDQCTTG